MTEPGKNAPGLRGFPTPNSVPADNGYTVFRFPNDNEWAGILLGALETLTKEYNWYEWGSISPAEAAETWRTIIEAAPYNTCGCSNPSGGRVLRLTTSGHVQEINDDGEWADPTGDYAVPPVPAREGGTPEDQICLAAANCTNVLQILYENLSDSWNAALSDAEALTALVLALVALIGAEFAPITFALVTFFGWLFGVLYETLAFVGADLWDENFTSALKCILVGCATNTDGVITFDWTCFNSALAAQVNVFDLTASQLRLFGQLQYILSVIGGVDALNAAGATTAITDADCSDCPSGWCIHYESDDWPSWEASTDVAFLQANSGDGAVTHAVAAPTAGIGWVGSGYGSGHVPVASVLDLGAVYHLTSFSIHGEAGGSGAPFLALLWGETGIDGSTGMYGQTDGTTIDVMARYLMVWAYAAGTCGVYDVSVMGDGVDPFPDNACP